MFIEVTDKETGFRRIVNSEFIGQVFKDGEITVIETKAGKYIFVKESIMTISARLEIGV